VTLVRLATLFVVLTAGLALAGCGDSSSGDSTLEEEIQQLKDAKRERELAELQRRLKA
jgi:hypothetical protein